MSLKIINFINKNQKKYLIYIYIKKLINNKIKYKKLFKILNLIIKKLKLKNSSILKFWIKIKLLQNKKLLKIEVLIIKNN